MCKDYPLSEIKVWGNMQRYRQGETNIIEDKYSFYSLHSAWFSWQSCEYSKIQYLLQIKETIKE